MLIRNVKHHKSQKGDPYVTFTLVLREGDGFGKNHGWLYYPKVKRVFAPRSISKRGIKVPTWSFDQVFSKAIKAEVEATLALQSEEWPWSRIRESVVALEKLPKEEFAKIVRYVNDMLTEEDKKFAKDAAEAEFDKGEEDLDEDAEDEETEEPE